MPARTIFHRVAISSLVILAVLGSIGCKRLNYPYAGKDETSHEADHSQPEYTVKVDPNAAPAK